MIDEKKPGVEVQPVQGAVITAPAPAAAVATAPPAAPAPVAAVDVKSAPAPVAAVQLSDKK